MGLGLEERRHGDAAGRADDGEVVAQQIDDHEVLGAVLRVGGERAAQAVVLARRRAPARRPLHRAGDDAARSVGSRRVDAEEEFGREARNLDRRARPVEPNRQKRAVRHGLGGAEGGVERGERRLGCGGEREREVDLVDIALADECADAFVACGVIGEAERGRPLWKGRGTGPSSGGHAASGVGAS